MKPALLMIPALCCNEKLYAGVAAALADLVEPRLVNPAKATLAACAEEVLAAAPRRFAVMGTSFGGNVAREVALSAPERVIGLWNMCAGASAPADPAAGRRRGELLRTGRKAELFDDFARTIAYLPGRRGAEATAAFRAMAEEDDPELIALRADALAVRPDRWGEIHRIACPALLLWGREDTFSPTADGLRMAGLIPRARYIEIPDCGHLPTLEAPEETIAAARHWLIDTLA